MRFMNEIKFEKVYTTTSLISQISASSPSKSLVHRNSRPSRLPMSLFQNTAVCWSLLIKHLGERIATPAWPQMMCKLRFVIKGRISSFETRSMKRAYMKFACPICLDFSFLERDSMPILISSNRHNSPLPRCRTYTVFIIRRKVINLIRQKIVEYRGAGDHMDVWA